MQIPAVFLKVFLDGPCVDLSCLAKAYNNKNRREVSSFHDCVSQIPLFAHAHFGDNGYYTIKLKKQNKEMLSILIALNPMLALDQDYEKDEQVDEFKNKLYSRLPELYKKYNYKQYRYVLSELFTMLNMNDFSSSNALWHACSDFMQINLFVIDNTGVMHQMSDVEYKQDIVIFRNDGEVGPILSNDTPIYVKTRQQWTRLEELVLRKALNSLSKNELIAKANGLQICLLQPTKPLLINQLVPTMLSPPTSL